MSGHDDTTANVPFSPSDTDLLAEIASSKDKQKTWRVATLLFVDASESNRVDEGQKESRRGQRSLAKELLALGWVLLTIKGTFNSYPFASAALINYLPCAFEGHLIRHQVYTVND